MYCTNCASQLPDHARFCKVCGAKTAVQLREEAPPPAGTGPAAPPPAQPPVPSAVPPPPAMAYTPPPPPMASPAQPPAPVYAMPNSQGPLAPRERPKRRGKALPILAALAVTAAAVTGAWRFGLLDALPFISADAPQDIPSWAAVADAGAARAPAFAPVDADDTSAEDAERESQPSGDSPEGALHPEEAAADGETAEESGYTQEELYDLMERGLLTEEQQRAFEMEMAKRAEMEAAGLEEHSGYVQSWGGVSITVLASSAMEGTDYSYGAGNVLDNDPGTAWTEDANGHGIGEWIMVTTSNTTPARLSHLAIQNGYQKNTKTYTPRIPAQRISSSIFPTAFKWSTPWRTQTAGRRSPCLWISKLPILKSPS